ncbi:MAG TPA: hypothetical protein VFW25_03065 [Silvibacterium sp.]|nr:hypothetical protein [Silvibacterium sp.]
MNTSIENPPSSLVRHAGPPLLLLALIYAGLMVAGGSTLRAAFAVPHGSAEAAVAYVAQHGWAIRWGSFCELGSAMPLLLFVAVTVSRLRFLRVRAAGEMIALSGGIVASGMLVLSSLATWSLTRPGVAEATGAVRALQAVGFAGGGPGFAVPLGLFVAGVSVTAGLHKLIPRWIMWLGLAVAAACELASLTLLVWQAGYFIPVGRFIGVVWMIAAAVTLPVSMARARAGIRGSGHCS